MWKARLAALVVTGAATVAGFGTTVLAQGATQAAAAGKGASRAPAAARDLPPALRRSGRWTRIHGKRVWAVSLVMQVDRHGRAVARSANTWTSRLQNYGTGLCISSYPGSHGAHIHQYGCNGSANQTWEYYFDPGAAIWNFYNAGDGYCMDNYQGRNTTYNPQIMWGCSEGSAIPLEHSIGASAVGGYLIHTEQALGQWSGYCLSSMGNRNEGSEVQLAVCNTSAANQSWASSAPLG